MAEKVSCGPAVEGRTPTPERQALVDKWKEESFDEPLKEGNKKINDLADALAEEKNFSMRGGAARWLICFGEGAALTSIAAYKKGVTENPDEYGAGHKAVRETPNEAKTQALVQMAEEDVLLNAKQQFQEQCYLISKMKELASANNSSGYEYIYFTALSNNDVSTSLNKLLYQDGAQALRDIKGSEIAALVPILRVFAVQWSGTAGDRRNVNQDEYRFQGGFMDLDKLKLDYAARGKNIGIRSFSWDFQGTDPFTSPRAITATLTLFGDSIRAFEDKHYETLLMRAGAPKGGGKFDHIETKVIVGWSAPDAIGIMTPHLSQAIKANRLSFMMTLNSHTFNFQQDGSFELELSYNGRIETALNEVNLLSLEGGSEEAKVTSSSLAHAKKKAKTDLKKIRNRGMSPAPAPAGPVNPSFTPEKTHEDEVRELRETSIISDTEAAEIAANLEGQGQGVESAEIARAIQAGTLEDLSLEDVKTRTADKYSLILREIEKLGGSNGRIFSISVQSEEFQRYFEQYGGVGTKTAKSKTDKDTPGTPPSKPKESEKPPKKKPTPTPKATPTSAPTSINMKTIIKSPKSETENLTNIPYVFFGDLIEIVTKIAESELKKRRLKFILGNMAYRDRMSTKQSVINLADIPISIRTYSAWFHKNYVKKVVSNIPLNDFINKMITEIISPALGRRCFRDAGSLPPGANRVGIHTLSSPKQIPTGRVRADSIRGWLVNTGDSKKSSRWNYVFVQSNLDPTPNLTGRALTDPPEIIHLFLGRDRGLVKSATFSKVNNPNLKAHLMTKEMGGAVERAKEPYNVDIEMIGNNFFRPGVRFHLTPTLPGKAGKDLAKNLGLGGYYMTLGTQGSITPGAFTTSIRGRWETEGGKIKGKKKKKVGKKAESTARDIDAPVKK